MPWKKWRKSWKNRNKLTYTPNQKGLLDERAFFFDYIRTPAVATTELPPHKAAELNTS